jgi:hypothetical protein
MPHDDRAPRRQDDDRRLMLCRAGRFVAEI